MADTVVRYHWTNTAIAVFYSDLGWSFWALFPENCASLPESSDSHLNAESFYLTRRHHPSSPSPRLPTRKRQDCQDSLGTVLRPSKEQDRNDLELKPLEAATSTCFRLTVVALTPTNIHIRHRHRQRGVMSKKHRHRPSCKFLSP